MKLSLSVSIAASLLWVTSAVHAAPVCVGSAGTEKVCTSIKPGVLTEVQPIINDCVYLGGDTCTPVVFPGPGTYVRTLPEVEYIDCEGLYDCSP